jgi:sugar phosphate isomerase/epimerase
MVELAFHSLHFSPMLGGPGRPLEDIIAATAAAGFPLLGLDLPEIEEYRSRGKTVADLAEEFRRAGLRCCDLLPFFAAAGVDARRRAEELEALGLLAAELGAPLVVAGVPRQLPWQELCGQLGEAARVLAPAGVRLAVEYMPHSGLKTLAEAVRVCGELGWERAGLVVDSIHSCFGGATAEEIAGLAPGQIALVQYSDACTTAPADLLAESRDRRLLPGAGCLPLGEWRAAVRATGFDGVVAAEVLSDELRESGAVAATARDCYLALQADWPAGDASSDGPI